jgi:histidyl-tRNA synthetase
VPYDIDPTLVRGLDYYTRTVFEFESSELGAQSGLGGGGRYDLLIEQLGGPPTAGVGWAAGVERMVLASSDGVAAAPVDVYVALDGGDARSAFSLVQRLRRDGVAAQMEQAGRSMKGQLKQADRLGARKVAILADNGVRVRDMQSGEQEDFESVDDAIGSLR